MVCPALRPLTAVFQL